VAKGTAPQIISQVMFPHFAKDPTTTSENGVGTGGPPRLHAGVAVKPEIGDTGDGGGVGELT